MKFVVLNEVCHGIPSLGQCREIGLGPFALLFTNHRIT
jgi:hypothetical protein